MLVKPKTRGKRIENIEGQKEIFDLLLWNFINTSNKKNSGFKVIKRAKTKWNTFNTFNKVISTFNKAIIKRISKRMNNILFKFIVILFIFFIIWTLVNLKALLAKATIWKRSEIIVALGNNCLNKS